MPDAPGRVSVTVELDRAMVEWLDHMAAMRRTDRSEVVRSLIAAVKGG